MSFSGIKLFLSLVILFASLTTDANQKDTHLQNIKTHLAKHEASLMEKEAFKLLQLSTANQDLANRSEALKFLGIAKHLQAKYDSAIIWYQQALDISIEQNDTLNIGKSYLNIATSFNAKGDFENAIKNAMLALKSFEAINDKNGQARVQNLIGIFYFHRNNFKIALDFFTKYKQLAIASKDTGEIVSSMNNMGSALHEMEEYE